MARTRKAGPDRANTATEARIRKLEQELAFARNPTVHVKVGRDRRILEADDAFARIARRSAKRLTTLRLDDVLSPYQGKVDVVFDHFLRGVPYPGPAKPFLTMEIRGTGRFFEFTFRPRRNRRGTIQSFQISGREVTTEMLRRRVAQYHRTGEAIHRTLDRMHLGCLHAYNTRGNRFTSATLIGGVTNKLAELLGFTVRDIPGQDFKAKPQLYRHPVTRLLAPGTIRALNLCLAEGTEDWTDGEIVAGDGVPRPAKLFIMGNVGVWGNAVFTVLICDRSEEESTIRQLSRRISDSEARYRSLFESASDAIFLADLDYTIMDCNKRASEQYGYTHDELVGQDIRILTSPETSTRVSELSSQVRNKGGACIEATGRTRDGRLIETEVSIRTVEVGDRSFLLVMCHDLTERKQAERALRESEQRYRSLFDSVPVGLFRTTPDGRVLDANTTMAQMLGFPDRETLIGRSAWESYGDPRVREAWQARIDREGVVREHEMQLQRRDGTPFWIMHSARAIRDATGRICCYEGAIQDISERKAVEEALRASEASYRAVVEDQTECICRFQPGGKITFVNDVCARYVSMTPEELVGESFLPFLPEDDRRNVEKALSALTPQNPVVSTEHRVQAPTGDISWQQWTNRGVFDKEGRLAEIQAVGRDVTQRREAEEALRESEAKYRALVEHSLQGLVVAQGTPPRLVFVNKAFADMLGYTVDEVCGLPPEKVKALVHRDDREVFFSRYLARVGGGQVTARYEFRAMHKDGTIRWVEISATCIEYQGAPAVQATFVDITERREFDRRIRESEARYRDLVEKMREVIYTLDTKGRVTSVNEAVTQMLGYEPKEIIGHSFSEWVPRAYLSTTAAALESIFAGREITAETVLIDRNGACHDVEFSSSPIVSDEGIVGSRGIVRDITERKRLEQEIRDSESKYRALVEGLNAGLIIIKDGVVRLVNRAYEEISGYKSAEVCGRPFDHSIVEADRERVRSSYLAREAGRSAPSQIEVRCLHADGRELTIEATSSLVQYEGGRATQVIVRDLTERKLLQRQLQRAARLASVGTLAAGVAHEVNNPLAVISVDLLRLKRQFEDDPFVAKLSAKLLRMTKRIAHITGGLLTFSKATGGAFGMHALHGPLNVALDLMQSRFDYEQKVLTRNYAPQLPTLWCDSDQLQQVFVNLCINALEAMPRGGTLTVSTETSRRDKTVAVHFADTGQGIPAGAIDRAFDPFFTTKDSGTGLGLAICHSIIEDHGGRITLASEPGRGTTVSVVLPISRPSHGENPGGVL